MISPKTYGIPFTVIRVIGAVVFASPSVHDTSISFHPIAELLTLLRLTVFGLLSIITTYVSVLVPAAFLA